MLGILWGGVAHRLAVVAAQSDAQTWNTVVVYTGSHSIFVGYLKLVWTLGTALNPVAATETVGVQASQELCLIAELAALAPETDTGLVPGARKNGVFAFRTINSKEIQWLMIGIGQTYRYHDVTHLDVGSSAERLLNPELFEFHLSTFLHFLLVLDGFLCLVFDRLSGTSVFKLNLSTHGPSLSEVVTQVDDCMRNVEASVVGSILISSSVRVAFAGVAIEVAAHGNLAITADAELVTSYVLHHTIGSHSLCTCSCQTGNQGSGHQSNS